MLCLMGINWLLYAQNPTCLYTPYTKVFRPPYSPSGGGNTIQNGTFESGNLSGWSLLPNSSRIALTTNAYNSNYAVKLMSTDNAGGDVFVEQVISNLVAGNSYFMTCWLKSQTNNTSVNLNVRFNYPNGNYQVLSKPIMATTTWTKYTHTFTVPTTANLLLTLVQVSVYRGQNTDVFADSLDLSIPATSGFTFLNSTTPTAPVQPFYEDFKGNANDILSSNRWLVVKKTWGNSNTLNNNGVVPENVELLCTGGLRLHGHGDLFSGPVTGATTHLGNGKIRVCACIATKDYYASGKYDVVAKLTPGMVNAFWNFHYIEDAAYQSGGIKNSEIDWEFPSNNINGVKTDIVDGMCNGWRGLCNGDGFNSSYQVALGITDAATAFHKYSIEWHTGGNGITPSIKWYVDDVFIKEETNPSYIPFRASRFWLGVWFGNLNWIAGGNASLLQYVDRYMEVKSVSITPYYEAKDIYENETDPFIGYVTPSAYPSFPCTSIGMKSGRDSEPTTTIETEGELVCYPIPVQGELHLELSNQVSLRRVELRDVAGRIVFNQTLETDNNQYSFQTSTIPSGIYLLKVEDKQGKQYLKKLQW